MSVMMQNALSACVVDRDRIAVGTDDGLFCVDLDRDEICRIGDQKKIHQVRKEQRISLKTKTLRGDGRAAAEKMDKPCRRRHFLQPVKSSYPFKKSAGRQLARKFSFHR